MTRPRVAPEVGPIGARTERCCSGACAQVLALYVRPDTAAKKQRDPSTQRLSSKKRSSPTKQPCREADRAEAVALPRSKAGCAPQPRHEPKTPHRSRRRTAHLLSPRGTWNRASGGLATASEQRFRPYQSLAGTHPAVIAGLWFSSALLGGEVATRELAQLPLLQ